MYKEFFNLTNEMYCIYKKNGEIVDINEKFLEILDHNKEEITGNNINNYINPKDKYNATKSEKIVQEKKIEMNMTNRYVCKNEEYILLTWTIMFCDVNNLFFAKITHRNDDLLIAKVAHELKTPLNSINGYAQLLAEKKNMPIKENGYVDKILENCDVLLELITDVLDMTKIDYVNFNEKVLVNDILTECILENKYNIENNDLMLCYDATNSNYFIHINRLKIKQIINNLLSNAIKYNKQNGKIYISCEIQDEKIEIKIKDTGIGISQLNISKLFNPFERLDINTNKYIGSGLGLYITKKIIQTYNGSIICESKLNEYSIFKVEFNTSDKEENTICEGLTIAKNKKKILYIEDNINNILLIKKII